MHSFVKVAGFFAGFSTLGTGLVAAPVSINSWQTSPDCGSTNYSVSDFGSGTALDGQIVDRSALEVVFYDFANTIDRPGFSKKKCSISTELVIPAGYQFRAAAATVSGTYSISYLSEGSLSVEYKVDATNAKGRWSKSELTRSDDFSVTAEMDNLAFTPCVNRPTRVTLSSEIFSLLMSNENSYSEMIFDTQDNSIALKWDWNFKSCNSKPTRNLSGEWTSGYGSRLVLDYRSGNCKAGDSNEYYNFQTFYGLGTQRSGLMIRRCSSDRVTVNTRDGLSYEGRLGENLVWYNVPLKVGVRDVTWKR